MGDNNINGIDPYIQNFLKARSGLVKSGKRKPSTQQIISAMKQLNTGIHNDSVVVNGAQGQPTTKYMPPVPFNGGEPTTRYMPPVPPQPEPDTKYMPPVPPQPEPDTKYMPPVLPSGSEPTTRYMPPVPPEKPEK